MKYSFLYILVSVMAIVLTEYAIEKIPVIYVLACTNLFAIIFFNTLNIKRLKIVYSMLLNKDLIISVVRVNSLITIMWFCYFFAVSLCGATDFMLLCYLFVAVPAGILNRQLKKITSILIVVIIFFIEFYNQIHIVEGGVISLIGGTATYFYFKESETLNKKYNFSSLDVLCIRFYLLVIISMVFVFLDSNVIFNIEQIPYMIILSILTLILPLYLAQIGISKIGAMNHSFFITFMPFLTFISEDLVFHNLSWQVLILSLLPPVILNVDYFKQNILLKIRNKNVR
ncbi:hypothetical protein [Francisella sp. 19X1-34]|uniref:hypothetical protein n=1 Tax=Francisella sp. 19X1-34 TaxID=3087177 RepID=UPI002E30F734|nr:hypothetical protein [Francisella sp. 19X1-34]MED7788450.1 hypothetical protein [Francisella sp. 19X1-34]